MQPPGADRGARWRICADTGGTFTDVIAEDPSGRQLRLKVLSSSRLRGLVRERLSERRVVIEGAWPRGEGLLAGSDFRALAGGHPASRRVVGDHEGGRLLELDGPLPREIGAGSPFELSFDEPPALLGARLLTNTRPGNALPSVSLRVGTTLATNALLTSRVAPAVLFVTEGFADLLEIGSQQRPDIFALRVEKPAPLYAGVVEVRERVAADGSRLVPLDLDRIARDAAAWIDGGARAAAVALLHADRHPDHERQLAARLAELGFDHVSCSHEMAGQIKIVPRATTAVVDATLSSLVAGHLESISSAVPDGSLHVMTSSGGLAAAHGVRAKDMLLSGPAAGVVGAAGAGRQAQAGSVIGFDMGGTSTDVARWAGDFEYVFVHRVGGAEIVAPALDIHTVAAGGGSICDVDANGLRVGPESAGAVPGPSCYGAGGPLTLTDVNLLLGRLDPARFRIPIDMEAARRAARGVLERLDALHGQRPKLDALLEGLLEIANERMAGAIREISVRRGVDPADDVLVAFGGAGGQHACAVARRLGMTRIVVPADAGLLSARGLAEAAVERFASRQVLARLEDAAPRLRSWTGRLERDAIAAVARESRDPGAIAIRRRLATLRFTGQDATLDVDMPLDGAGAPDAARLDASFRARYRAIYGYLPAGRAVELVSIDVIAATVAPARAPCPPPEGDGPAPACDARTSARFAAQLVETPVFERDRLAAGALLDGPALVVDPFSTTVVEPGWRAVADARGNLHVRLIDVRAEAPAGAAGRDEESPEEVRLELFTHRFETIAREMGRALERSAVSTNVKERLDFSCALLDEAGMLVVNAPHVPVHLGSLGLCVREVAGELKLEPGDVVVTNHPAYGGSHLPDVTVIEPVFAAGPDVPPQLVGYVAARAHHAEIGGIRPGSMPPGARRLVEEGVVIPPVYLFRRGEPRWDVLRTLLESADYPSRAVEDNLADARAAVAACRRGACELASLAELHGRATIRRYMDALARRAARRLSEELAARADGRADCRDTLDDGTPIAVAVEIAGDRARIDFRGSAGVHPGNLNATPAIVRSVVLYALRLMIDEPLPLNEGLMRAVELVVEPGLLDPPFGSDPRAAPAVVGGNVETSQRLVDLLLEAFGLAANSQGTMNNTLFGDERASYYETVCGGCGAGPGFDGASAVHSHMTNTRITDPEILETRHPVRLVRFARRRGSGGAGRWRGGDGVVREIAFLAPLSLSLLTQHRERGPRGLDGGRHGAAGRQRLVRADGRVEELLSVDEREVGPGDRLILETPGGGGWGGLESEE